MVKIKGTLSFVLLSFYSKQLCNLQQIIWLILWLVVKFCKGLWFDWNFTRFWSNYFSFGYIIGLSEALCSTRHPAVEYLFVNILWSCKMLILWIPMPSNLKHKVVQNALYIKMQSLLYTNFSTTLSTKPICSFALVWWCYFSFPRVATRNKYNYQTVWHLIIMIFTGKNKAESSSAFILYMTSSDLYDRFC